MTIGLRSDYSSLDLRRLAKTARTTSASRRMLSLALILEGAKRGEAAKAGGMDGQTLCDWVYRFNAEGPEGLYDKQRPGPSCRLSEAQQQELVAIIEAGPDLAEHGVVRFRLCDLCALVEERFGVTYHEQGLSKLIKKLGFRRISARPQHPKSDPEIQAEYKKNSMIWSGKRSATELLNAR
jgi:transposase